MEIPPLRKGKDGECHSSLFLLMLLILIAAYETVIGVLILAKDRMVQFGLAGGLVFQVGLAPALGFGGVVNLFLAASQGFLLTKAFDLTFANALRGELGGCNFSLPAFLLMKNTGRGRNQLSP